MIGSLTNTLRSFYAKGCSAFLLPLFVTSISGCGDTTMKWKEQVDLQDNQTVIVARTATMEGNWVAGGGGGSVVKKMTLEIVQPTTSGNPGKWVDHFVPVLMDRDPDSGEWFIVATFYHCTEWYELGRPALPYTEYRFRDGKWVRQPLSEKWIGRKINVLPADLSDKKYLKQKEVLSTERKWFIFSSPAIAERFIRIVGTWRTTC